MVVCGTNVVGCATREVVCGTSVVGCAARVVGHATRVEVCRTSKGVAGPDNLTFEACLVIFVCEVPPSPGKVPSTPVVFLCPFCSLDCPFFCWSCPLFPKWYALLRMVTPFTEGVTPFADGLRSLPKDNRLYLPFPKGYASKGGCE